MLEKIAEYLYEDALEKLAMADELLDIAEDYDVYDYLDDYDDYEYDYEDEDDVEKVAAWLAEGVEAGILDYGDAEEILKTAALFGGKKVNPAIKMIDTLTAKLKKAPLIGKLYAKLPKKKKIKLPGKKKPIKITKKQMERMLTTALLAGGTGAGVAGGIAAYKTMKE